METAAGYPRRKRRRDLLEQRRFLGPALLSPAIIFIVLLVGAPLGLSIYLSLTDATAGSLTGDFIGLDNFTSQWSDPNFRTAFRNTIVFTLLANAIIVVGASILAHFLIRPFRGKWFLRFLILLPWAAPVALSTIGFLWIFDSLFSVVNWVLKSLSLVDTFNPPQWLGDPTLALAAITTVHAWRLLPFATVIMIAGLASIPTEVNDAARVDGATGLKKLWYVTLPLQLPIATIAVLFGIVFTATDMAVVYILTRGGPFNSTQTLPMWAFQTGIGSGSLGAGAAIALYLLPVLALVTVLMLVFARRVEVT
ncbi:ABC-type sugar transport system permease component [Gaiella occulta]|uniref:ABC-type sugar transport system permease component n=1 Tax=Gaiella occulta TaxID=1002870 RepID=A0A7M2YW63_9ACTN|nr:sugar ABC transporter permease [Gaiella occulta]RDI74134.1 ABC-type sugar transport system permease component [Gaiella occulta]